MSATIDHVIVLMLENRSFDHLLGYLDHPDPDGFPGLKGTETIPRDGSSGGGPMVPVTDTGTRSVIVGPGHHFEDVMQQLGSSDSGGGNFSRPDNRGFVANYEKLVQRKKGAEAAEAHFQDVVACLKPGKTPVLSMLAREFAVCTRWHCSVPGMTWPNRNYVHSGTSEGDVDIVKLNYGRYRAKTIFSLLQDADKSWKIYRGGFTQTLVFTELLFRWRWGRYKRIGKLLKGIKHDRLPSYSFVEPRHFWPNSNSQHPSNNKGTNENRKDFFRAEQLIADVYNALRENPDVFKKTLLLVTYDEHGGFFDRESPPMQGDAGAGPVVAPDDDHKKKDHKFGFNILGPRVPAVAVSPWIPRGTIDDTLYDHTSALKTICDLFDLDPTQLRNRVPKANGLTHLFEKSTTLRADLPPAEPLPFTPEPGAEAIAAAAGPPLEPEFDDFHDAMVTLAVQIEAIAKAEDEPAAAAAAETLGPEQLDSMVAQRRSEFDSGRDEERFTDDVMEMVIDQGEANHFDLETTSGKLIDLPSGEDIERYLTETLESGDDEIAMTLTDGRDRSLTVSGRGNARYLDLDRDEVRTGTDFSKDGLSLMLEELHRGSVSLIRTRLTEKSAP